MIRTVGLKPDFKKIHAPQSSQKHYSQKPRHGNNLCPEDGYGRCCVLYIMECHSATEKNEIMPFEATWRDLEITK